LAPEKDREGSKRKLGYGSRRQLGVGGIGVVWIDERAAIDEQLKFCDEDDGMR
jgi:hypothetical protein